jgi:hypothetical protein
MEKTLLKHSFLFNISVSISRMKRKSVSWDKFNIETYGSHPMLRKEQNPLQCE